MGLEIERKFLIANSDWKNYSDEGLSIKQGYLNSHNERVVRIRIIGEKGIITIKGKTVNTSRLEFEYEIPLADAEEIMTLAEKPIIEKIRYELINDSNLWEIDVFDGENKGLIVAEIELEDENQIFERPSWLGREVSHEEKYYNSNLIKNPFVKWGT